MFDNLRQSIQYPLGANVFGSSIMRVKPDLVVIKFSVSRLEQEPKKAFQETRQAAQNIQNYLAQSKVSDFGLSHATMFPSFRYVGTEEKFLGYSASISFNVRLQDLIRLEEILTGIVDAGANRIENVDFQTSRLKELRAEARRRAVDAAREKAENYCKAAGVMLGSVIHIEDINPEKLRGREGHVAREMQSDNEDDSSALDPSSIAIGAAVLVAFEIQK
jgi:uncharacterized protein